MRNFLLAVAVVFSCLLEVGAQNLTLEQTEERLKVELSRLADQRREKEDGLRKSYMAALLRFEARARAEGDLSGVQYARAEMARVEHEPSLLPETPATHPEVARMHEVMARQLDEFALVESRGIVERVTAVSRFAEAQATSLTQQNRIDEALAWREWARNLPQRPEVAGALARVETAVTTADGSGSAPPPNQHPAFLYPSETLIAQEGAEFADTPRAYRLGFEPKGTEKRVNMSTPSMQGAGNHLFTVQLRLVEEETILSKSFSGYVSYRNKAHVFVPRIQLGLLPGKTLGRSLVVFDLYRRGSGGRREVIRTQFLVLPPLAAGQQVVVDAGVYAYESERIRSSGGRIENLSADEFNGFIVTLFDESGRMILQRSSDRLLDGSARNAPPAVDPPPPPSPEQPPLPASPEPPPETEPSFPPPAPDRMQPPPPMPPGPVLPPLED